MFSILGSLIGHIIVICLVRWGYHAIVKRQRIDWTGERKLLSESATKGNRIVIRLTRWYWRRF